MAYVLSDAVLKTQNHYAKPKDQNKVVEQVQREGVAYRTWAYGAQTWVLTKAQEKKLEVTELRSWTR